MTLNYPATNPRLHQNFVWQLEHSESKLLIADCELAGVAKEALELIQDQAHRPRLIQAEDSRHPEWSADGGEELKDFLRSSIYVNAWRST